jgi:plasmid stability protein
MSRALTIRADDDLRRALEARAAAEATTVSELVRRILRQAVAEVPLAVKAGHLAGRLEIPEDDDPWRRELRSRNWRR